jgi:amidase
MANPETILLEGGVAGLRDGLAAGHFSVRDAVGFYLARIAAGNPTINAVKELAPDALAQATLADAAIAAGKPLGPLHGIPVLLKDNICTADGAAMSAGAEALRGFVPRREATLVFRLRQAGAIILGKTNLTEFADYVSDVMPSGFSGGGGMVRNPHSGPYGRGQGSSVGSAAAVAAGFAPVAIGSETQNSLQTPACVSSVFGFKPSVALVSRHGVVPLVPSQDSPGPLTRCAEDAALLVSVLAGADVRDSLSLSRTLDDSPDLALNRLRIGVPRRTIIDHPDFAAVMPAFEQALSALSAAGARIIDPCDLPSAEQLRDVASSVFRTEFKAALNGFLEDHDAPCGIGSLAALIDWNERHPNAIPHGQNLLVAAEQTKGLGDPTYQRDRDRDLLLSRTAGIDAALSLGVDVLMVPMTALAKCTGKAGAPVFAIPIGLDATGSPIGITLCAGLGQDGILLRAGRAVAQVIARRQLVAS